MVLLNVFTSYGLKMWGFYLTHLNKMFLTRKKKKRLWAISAFNPSTGDMDGDGAEAGTTPEFEVSLGYPVRPCVSRTWKTRRTLMQYTKEYKNPTLSSGSLLTSCLSLSSGKIIGMCYLCHVRIRLFFENLKNIANTIDILG